MYFLAIFIVLAVLDCIYFNLKYRRKHGPAVWSAFPFVGIVPVLLLPVRFYRPIYKWYLRTAPDLVITRHFYPLVLVKGHYIAEVQKNEFLVHRTSYPFFEILGELTTGKLGWSLFDGGWLNSDWRGNRKVNVQALHVLPKRQKFARISEVVDTFVKRIEEQNGEPWDYEDTLTFSKFQESANLNLGATLDNDEILHFARKLKVVLSAAIGLFLLSALMPLRVITFFERLLPHSRRPSVFARVYKHLLLRIQEHKMDASGAEARDYVEALLRIQDSEAAHTTLREHAMFLLIASTMTTVHSTTSALSYLALLPKYQRMIWEEFRQIVGSEELNLDHLEKMHFLRAVVNEGLRMSPPVTLIERFTRVPTRLEDFKIPANLSCLLMIQSEMVDPKTYPDPETFNPLRFLDENFKTKDSCNAAFSRGKRNCPGQDIAIMSTAVYIAKIVQHFEFSPACENVEIPEYEGGLFPNLPKIPLRFIRRPEAPAIQPAPLKSGLSGIIRQAIEDGWEEDSASGKKSCISNADN